MLQQQLSELPKVVNADTKEAFYYQAVHTKALIDLINKPDSLINALEQGASR